MMSTNTVTAFSTKSLQSKTDLKKENTTNLSWLTQKLRKARILDPEYFVTSIQTQTIGEKVGFLSETKVIKLNYNKELPNCLSEILLKELPEDKQSQEMEKSVNGFEREVSFYQNLAKLAPIRLPKVYFTQLNSHQKLLAMEYLSSLEAGDQVQGLTHGQIQNIIENIAKLHAYFWQNESLKAFSWLPNGDGAISQYFTENWHGAAGMASSIIGVEGVKIFEKIVGNWEKILEIIKNRPYTLAHMDLRADNILLNPFNPKEPVILDWQLVTRTMGAFDLARLVGGSEMDGQRQGKQLELVSLWHQVLKSKGVSHYCLNDAWFDFKLASLYWFVIAVLLYGCCQDEIKQGGRSASLFPQRVQRFWSNVRETSAINILE